MCRINPSLRPRRRGFWVACLFLLGLPSLACAQSANPLGPWTPTTWNGHLRLPPQAISKLIMVVDAQAFLVSQRVALPLEGGGSIMLIKVGEKRVGRSEVWLGRVEGDALSMATFAVTQGILTGDVVTSHGKAYRVDYAAPNGVVVIMELDVSRFPPESAVAPPPLTSGPPYAPRTAPAPSAPPPPPPGPAPAPAPACSDSPDRIDVMVLYTQRACAVAGNDTACSATAQIVTAGKIATAITEINTTYTNSSIARTVALAYQGLADGFTEGGSVDGDLHRLDADPPATADVPFINSLHTLRDQHAADIVVLIPKPSVEYDTPSSGATNPLPATNPYFEKNAFSVVPEDTATGIEYVFSHELGHAVGAGHDVGSPGIVIGNQLVHYNRGLAKPSEWRTVMAETSTCSNVGCPRIPRWSSPPDYGILNQNDNVRTLGETAATVANFRCAPQSQPHPVPCPPTVLIEGGDTVRTDCVP